MKLRTALPVAILSTLLATAPAIATEAYSQNHEAAKLYFQGGDEPSVKDAVWTAKDVFKVGMLSNGSDRSGFANYVCEVLTDYGFQGRGVWVQVIDIAALVNMNKWEKMGEAHCR